MARRKQEWTIEFKKVLVPLPPEMEVTFRAGIAWLARRILEKRLEKLRDEEKHLPIRDDAELDQTADGGDDRKADRRDRGG